LDLREIDGVVWTGLFWLRRVTSGGLLWTWLWTFGFRKMLGSSWVAPQLVASQEGLSSMKLVSWYEVTGFFSWPNYCSRTMTLGSTQPLEETSTRDLPGEWKAASRRVRLTTSPPSVNRLYK
jgi:hypothetical protein